MSSPYQSISTEAIVGVRRVDDSVSDVGILHSVCKDIVTSLFIFIIFENISIIINGYQVPRDFRVFQPGDVENTI